jgi:hypothetical protein
MARKEEVGSTYSVQDSTMIHLGFLFSAQLVRSRFVGSRGVALAINGSAII